MNLSLKLLAKGWLKKELPSEAERQDCGQQTLKPSIKSTLQWKPKLIYDFFGERPDHIEEYVLQ